MDAGEGQSDSANGLKKARIVKLKLEELNRSIRELPAKAAELFSQGMNFRRICYVN